MEQGNVLKSHGDVPKDTREQLYAEERQRLDRQPKPNNMLTPFPPINITNVLPHSHQSPMTSSSEPTPAAEVRPFGDTCLDIPGLRDHAIKEYSEWQQSNVGDEALKAEFAEACEVALQDGLDLEQVYEDQDPGFSSGTALSGHGGELLVDLLMTSRDGSNDTVLCKTAFTLRARHDSLKPLSYKESLL